MKGAAKKSAPKKKAPVRVGEARPLAQLGLLPGDVCDVFEDDQLVHAGAVYAEWISRGYAFRVAGVEGFVWPGPTARALVTRSPNRERKAEAADAEELDPLRRLVHDLPLLKDLDGGQRG